MKPILFFAIGILMFGCTSYQYVASPQYVPLNEKKGEMKANLTLNSFQFGYSIADNISIFSTGYYRHREPSLNLESALGKENSGAHYRKEDSFDINLGTSYFKKQKDIIYEVLVGSGCGHIYYKCIKDLMNDYEFTMNANKFNLYIQPNVGYKFQDFLELGVFSRFCYNNYFDLKTTTILGSNSTIESEDKYFSGKNKANLFFAEPGIFVKLGFPEVKFNLLFSRVYNLPEQGIRYRSLNLRLSFLLNLDVILKE